jgi:glyoxylase-like metal-dependent hydrolase (beta-lactamase superfamily II)
MTLDGTNSYLLAAPDASGVVVVDPGPPNAAHLAALTGAGPVSLILITHRHHDHTEAAAELHARTGAAVRALDPTHCHGGPPLQPGERITAAGISIDVIGTPGHTDDSVCFHLPDDHTSGGATGSVLTGDTILGRGTTVIAPPDGSVGAYLDSLRRLAALGPAHVLPAHGPDLPDLAAICAAYLAHRQERLEAIRAVLAELGPDASVQEVTDAVYTDIEPSVRPAAEWSVAAQLVYLRG